jgi:hypothetical protein
VVVVGGGVVVASLAVAAWSFQWIRPDHPAPNTPILAVYVPAASPFVAQLALYERVCPEANDCRSHACWNTLRPRRS